MAALAFGAAQLLAALTAPAAEPARTVALTFDDLPIQGRPNDLETARRINQRVLETLQAGKVPAIGFVNEGRVVVPGEAEARTKLLEQWLTAGASLGNHTFSHLSLHETPLSEFQEDVVRGEKITRALMEKHGAEPRYFRHPYTRTGPTQKVKQAFEEFLALRGYRVAPFTVENADYLFNAVYTDALEKGDHQLAQRVRSAYLDHNERMFEFFEQQAQRQFGRAIPQILLIHVNQINADTLGEMLTRLERRGYQFISLDEALRDPAYDTPDDYVGRAGLSWLHRWTLHQGVPMRLREEPEPPSDILARYQELQ